MTTKKKFYVEATEYRYYKGEWIEASNEKTAIEEYKGAIRAGLVTLWEAVVDVDCDEEIEEEVGQSEQRNDAK